jgi:hypothetical protein
MFNLKSHNSIDEIDLLRAELRIFDIIKSADGYDIQIGDEVVTAPTLPDCHKALDQGIKELKEHLYELWSDLADTSDKITQDSGQNSGGLDNLLFLSSVRKSLRLAIFFSELESLIGILRRMLDTDIASSDDRLIRHFNEDWIRIQCLHRLIMTELYRKKLICHLMQITKQAQISGPWANLDLPMKERVWEWDDGEEEYFDNRRRSRREQIRYNPEDATKTGFYYVWQDLTRDPYRFEDMKTDSPYKSRHLLSVP